MDERTPIRGSMCIYYVDTISVKENKSFKVTLIDFTALLLTFHRELR